MLGNQNHCTENAEEHFPIQSAPVKKTSQYQLEKIQTKSILASISKLLNIKARSSRVLLLVYADDTSHVRHAFADDTALFSCLLIRIGKEHQLIPKRRYCSKIKY